MSRMGLHNKKPWVKPRKLPFGAFGFSFTGEGGIDDHVHVKSINQTSFTLYGAFFKC
jgi:hypothetical protein